MPASNMSTTDRILRGMTGTVLLGLALFFPELPYAWLGWIGLVPLATGLLGWCGLYRLLGISTAPAHR